MEKIKEVLQERDCLLLEYKRLAEISTIITGRDEERIAFKGAKAATFDTKMRGEIISLWRGGILFRGVGRIEAQQNKYFQRLMAKLKEIGHSENTVVAFEVEDQEEKKLEEHLQVYAHDIALRTSRDRGTIGQLLQQKEINWIKLKSEVDAAMQSIQALVALLANLSFGESQHTRGNRLVSQFGLDVKFVSRNKLRQRFLEIDHWEDVLDMKERAKFHYKQLFEMLPAAMLLMDENKVTWEQIVKDLPALADSLFPVRFGSITNKFLGPNEENKIREMISPQSWPYLVNFLLLCKDPYSFEKYLKLLLFLKNDGLSWVEIIKIMELTKKSNAQEFFEEVFEITQLFQFSLNLFNVFKENNIKVMYAIDRGGRILGFLFFQVLQELGIHKITGYFIHGQNFIYSVDKSYAPGSSVTFYSEKQKKEIQGKNILLIDEFLETGTTLNAVSQELRKYATPGRVIPCVFSSKTGGYYSVSSKCPSWYKKKDYSGFDEKETGGVEVNRGAQAMARGVRKCLSKLAEAIALYIQFKTSK